MPAALGWRRPSNPVFLERQNLDRISDGESVEILPAEITVHLGEVIRIVNEDDEGHFVVIFYVGRVQP